MISIKTHMRKFILILSIIVIAVILLILQSNDKIEYNYKIESFVLISDIPYMVSEGTAYYWDDDNGVWIVCKEGVKELFRGENLGILKEDGSLEVGNAEYLNIDEEFTSLSALYSVEQTNKLLNISQNTPIRTLNTEPVSESCWALCEDGSMLINPGGEYIPFEIPNETIKDISAKFILTEEGNVYEISEDSWKPGEYSCKQVSEDKFIAIDACGSGTLCVGIRENHTVAMWSLPEWESLDLTEWKNVKEVAVGFNYCVGLTTNGKVLYAAYDKDMEMEVTKRLEGIKAQHITCCFETIAIIKNDLTVEKICPTVVQPKVGNQLKSVTDYRLSPIAVEDSFFVVCGWGGK